MDVFKDVQFPPSFLVIFVFPIQQTARKFKICRLLDSNRGPQVTVLPTATQLMWNWCWFSGRHDTPLTETTRFRFPRLKRQK